MDGSYRILEDEATADVAFEAWGKDLPAVFKAAADAVLGIMIESPEEIRPAGKRHFEIENDQLDLLLFNFLEQVLYYKDAEHFVVRTAAASVASTAGKWRVVADAEGERFDAQRHHQRVDVKAITLHDFSLVQHDGIWRAHVVLDI